MAPGFVREERGLSAWAKAAWFGALAVLCYIPLLSRLVMNWEDPDMGHGYFVPLVAGYLVWQNREELLAVTPRPNWWGLAVVVYGGIQIIIATLGVEMFLARTGWVFVLTGMVWLLGGNEFLKKLSFPLFLLLFMIPIPAIVYSRITLPLQFMATQLADGALTLLDIPVLREGNILQLPNQRLSVVEACSGIRSLLSLTFLSLVYGKMMDCSVTTRVVLFFSTIPIAILANGARVTITGIMTQINPALAEGFFHESTGWVIFLMSAAILVALHQAVQRISNRLRPRTTV